MRIIETDGDSAIKYKPTWNFADMNADNLTAFIKSYLAKDGKLAQTDIKSEDTPDKNDLPVKVVVGNTFKEMVSESKNDVLLLVYAPWCGHCKSLMPNYEKLAEELKDVKDLVIAKVDDTANELEGVKKVKGYPTVKFYKGGVIGTGKEMTAKFNRAEDKVVASAKNFLRRESSAYKTAFPNEKVEAEDWKPQESEPSADEEKS